ncbi:MAG: hypothetical protein Q4E51_05525 [Lachnospiraceae bacterium]|nr:hypothetical protein [Lachnospiraceae bacterium]
MDNNDVLIQNLTKRVYHLEQEIIKLGGQPYFKEDEPNLNSVPVQNVSPVDSPVTYTKEAPRNIEIVPSVNNIPTSNSTSVNKTSVKKNMENSIGKNGMAILASVLIFFSLILFAGIAFSYLSDIAKVVIMYVISIAIAAFGIIKMTKINAEKNGKFKTFYTTLAACGIGAIYITDLVAYFGFKCLPLVLFIIFLLVWIIVTMCLAHKYSPIFAYISNIGLIIATLLSAIQFNSSLMAFILYTICLIALYMILKKKSFGRDSLFFIQYPLVFIILSCAVETGILSYTVFTVLLMAVFFFANVTYKVEKIHLAPNIITLLLNVCAIIRICIDIDGNAILYVTAALLMAIMVLYLIRYYKNLRCLFYVAYGVTYIISAILLLITEMHIVIALIPFILFLVLGFIKKDVVIRAGGYFALLISYLIQIDFYETWIVFAIYFILLAAVFAFMMFVSYTMADKYIITALACILLMSVIDVFDLDICVFFVTFGIITCITNTKIYHKNMRTKADEISSKIIGYVFSAFMIFAGLVCSFTKSITPELYQVIIVLLITLIISCINTKNLFGIGIPEMSVGFYICIKFSLWICTVLHRLNAASYVISIIGILVAIVCIILGFKFRQKAFRLYGLIISMVSVVKLILFDISYDSNILRPVGFFVAGILCFAISFIYSKLEKSMSIEE